MKQWLWTLVILFFLTPAKSQNNGFVKDHIYVKVKDTWQLELAPYNYAWSGLNKAFLEYGVDIPGIEKPFSDTGLSKALSKVYRLRFTDTLRVDALIKDLEELPSIEYAEKEPIMRISYTPSDLQQSQWHLNKINAGMAWDFGKGSPAIRVAIVDNGVRTGHTDLAANIWKNPAEIPNNFLDDDLNGYVDDVQGYDVADGDNNANPPAATSTGAAFNHGTHCAGICAAVTDNGKGIASIGFKTSLIPVKCASDNSDGNILSDAYNGVYYAIKVKANVINMSFGSISGSETGQLLMDVANGFGITLVAAAGNDGDTILPFPAAYNHVISVGATTITDKVYRNSNYGKSVDLMAPGEDIYSTVAYDNTFDIMTGTSMAAPLVAGLSALIKSRNAGFSPEQIETALKRGCDNINTPNPDKIGLMGAGRINAYKAVNPAAAEISAFQKGCFEVYPNPSSNAITIQKESNLTAGYSVVLLSVSGKEILSPITIPEGMYGAVKIDVSNLPAGVYFLQFTSDGNPFSRKILICK